MLNIIVFIIILGILVLAHEFGHFIAAKKIGVKVEEFAFGFPPTLWSRIKGQTKYMINAIPFGGYVKLFGEDGAHPEDNSSFSHKNWLQRILVIVAGVGMNIILGAVILMIAFTLGLPVLSENPTQSYPYAHITNQVMIMEIQPDSPFQNYLQAGDQLLSVDQQSVSSLSDFKDKVANSTGEQVRLDILRQGTPMSFTAPVKYDEQSNKQIGVYLVEGQIIKYPFYLAIPMGIIECFRMLGAMVVALFTIVKNLIISQQAPAEIAGPVGIYQITAAARDMGLVYLLQLIALLNINLAIINILPLPALDGGRLLFIVIEKIRGRKVSIEIENLVHTVGFVVLIGLIILVTISDVRKFF